MARSLAIVVSSVVLGISIGSFTAVTAQGVVYSTPTYSSSTYSTASYPTETYSVSSYPPTSSVTTGQVCPKCGRIHGSSATVAPAGGTYTSNYSGNYSSVQPTSYSSNYSSGGTSNVLAMLNAQRARQGVGALTYDPTLQAVAQRRAQVMASQGLKNHPPGSFAPGRYEGVGWSSSFSPSGVSACYTSSPNMRYAGAAMARGRDGVYFAVVYR